MKKVTIVGLGALGSHLVLLARNWDVSIRIIDFDRVESKNVQSQLHTSMGIGKNKAVALQSTMRGLYRRDLESKPVKLTENNQDELLGGSDLVIDCTDNIAARLLIQNYCSKNKEAADKDWIDCLHGCLSADGTFARIIWTEHFIPDAEGEEGAATCEDGRNLPFHVQAAAMIAQIVQKYLETGMRQSWQITAFSAMRLM